MNQKFSLALYNVDSQFPNSSERIRIIAVQLKSLSPDIVILQNVSRTVYDYIFREMKSQGYNRYFPNEMSSKELSIALFSKFKIKNGEYISFLRGDQNRGYMRIELDISDNEAPLIFVEDVGGDDDDLITEESNSLIIYTSQLEVNPRGFGITKQQISMIAQDANRIKCENAIFAGDTSIREYNSAELHQPEGWSDCWYEMGNDKNRYTYDSRTNVLCPPPSKDRPDQVWFREGGNIDCCAYQLIGTDADPPVSSHYGVYVQFERAE